MKTIIFALIFQMTDKKGLNVEIYQVNDSTRLEVWHRNDTIFRTREYKFETLKK